MKIKWGWFWFGAFAASLIVTVLMARANALDESLDTVYRSEDDVITTWTSTIPIVPTCPDCICKPTTVSCPECPDIVCPECPACNCSCPDPCPSPCDSEDDLSGSYTIMGVGLANGWQNAEVTLGTFTIFPKGDFGWGYQCLIAGGVDRRGCQTYFLKKR